MGIAMRTLDEVRQCAECGAPFTVRKRKQEKENRIYCSLSCHWRVVGREKAQKTLDGFWDRMERCGHDGDLPCPYCCWIWKGARSTSGYGKVSHNGSDRPAHRRAWEIWNERTMPPELDGAHYCHTRRCCNPMHIHAATPKENMADALRDGRTLFGSRDGNSKLVETDIPEIFRLHYEGWTKKRIAVHFDVHVTSIQNVLARRTWKHVQITGDRLHYTRRGKRLHPDTPQVAQVHALRLQGKSLRVIADIVGLSEPTVYRYMLIAQRQPATLPDAQFVLSQAPEMPQIDRLSIYERDRGICHICKRKVSRKTFTIDHLIPRIYGGSNEPPNLAVAHLRCNVRRHTGKRIPAQLRLF